MQNILCFPYGTYVSLCPSSSYFLVRAFFLFPSDCPTTLRNDLATESISNTFQKTIRSLPRRDYFEHVTEDRTIVTS